MHDGLETRTVLQTRPCVNIVFFFIQANSTKASVCKIRILDNVQKESITVLAPVFRNILSKLSASHFFFYIYEYDMKVVRENNKALNCERTLCNHSNEIIYNFTHD